MSCKIVVVRRMVTKVYRLLLLKSTSPEELFARKVLSLWCDHVWTNNIGVHNF